MSGWLQSQTNAGPAPKPAFTPAPSGLLQRKCACGSAPGMDGECSECRGKRLTVQRRAVKRGAPAAVPPIVHDVLRSPGQPLAPAIRAFMEPRFGHDFSRVRVHTDGRAAESARAVGAMGYTVGRDIVFEVGQYAPGTEAGRRLLAHELAHVVQQRQGGHVWPRALAVSSPGDAAEREADATAQRVAAGDSRQAPIEISAPPNLQRLPFGIQLPSGIRSLDPTVEMPLATSVYGSSLNYGDIYLSDALGAAGRPFTTYAPGLGTVINVGPSAFTTPGSNPSLLIHELAHSWQSQHDPTRIGFMDNSIKSQTLAAVAGGSAYCYIPGKSFGFYGAEQIAQQVENGEAPIVAHVASVSAGAVDAENLKSLALPRWETPGAPGVKC